MQCRINSLAFYKVDSNLSTEKKSHFLPLARTGLRRMDEKEFHLCRELYSPYPWKAQAACNSCHVCVLLFTVRHHFSYKQRPDSHYPADCCPSPALIWPPLGLPQSQARAPGGSLLTGWQKQVTALEALFRSRLWPASRGVQFPLVSCGVAIETIESQNGI